MLKEERLGRRKRRRTGVNEVFWSHCQFVEDDWNHLAKAGGGRGVGKERKMERGSRVR